MRPKKLVLVCLLCLAGAFVYLLTRPEPKEPPSTPAASQPNQPSDNQSQNQGFDKSRYSLTDPASPWVIVNKQASLPEGYVPANLMVPGVPLRLANSNEQMKLDKRAASALEALVAAAAEDGWQLVLSSGYRSEALQRQFYSNYAARDGQTAADRYSARPGHSEHQTGLAADMMNRADDCHLAICFGDLPEGKWLAANAHRFGFVIRYPKAKEAITGYQYEPWHLRYVGKELAAEVHNSGVSLEEFFGLPAAASYGS